MIKTNRIVSLIHSNRNIFHSNPRSPPAFSSKPALKLFWSFSVSRHSSFVFVRLLGPGRNFGLSGRSFIHFSRSIQLIIIVIDHTVRHVIVKLFSLGDYKKNRYPVSTPPSFLFFFLLQLTEEKLYCSPQHNDDLIWGLCDSNGIRSLCCAK